MEGGEGQERGGLALCLCRKGGGREEGLESGLGRAGRECVFFFACAKRKERSKKRQRQKVAMHTHTHNISLPTFRCCFLRKRGGEGRSMPRGPIFSVACTLLLAPRPTGHQHHAPPSADTPWPSATSCTLMHVPPYFTTTHRSTGRRWSRLVVFQSEGAVLTAATASQSTPSTSLFLVAACSSPSRRTKFGPPPRPAATSKSTRYSCA